MRESCGQLPCYQYLRTLVLVVIPLLLFGNATPASPWPAEGTSWFFEAYAPWAGDRHYWHYEAGEVAELGGFSCREVTITKYAETSRQEPSEYFRMDEQKVYYWRYDRWCLLYDFAALPGDTIWVVDPEVHQHNPDTLSPMIVDRLGTLDEVFGQAYVAAGSDPVVQYLRPVDGNQLTFNAPVVAGVGCIQALLPEGLFFIPGQSEGPIRCFHGPELTIEGPEACELLLVDYNLNETEGPWLQVYPNPATDIINIRHPFDAPELQLMLVNREGRIVRQTVVSLAHSRFGIQLSTEGLQGGVYRLIVGTAVARYSATVLVAAH